MARSTQPELIICTIPGAGSDSLSVRLRECGLADPNHHMAAVPAAKTAKDARQTLKKLADLCSTGDGIASLQLSLPQARLLDRICRTAGLGDKGSAWSGLAAHLGASIWVMVSRPSIVETAARRRIQLASRTAKPKPKGAAMFAAAYSLDGMREQVCSIGAEEHGWATALRRIGTVPVRLNLGDRDGVTGFIAGLAERHGIKIKKPKGADLPDDAPPVIARVAGRFCADLRKSGGDARHRTSDAIETVGEVAKRWVSTPYYDNVEKHAKTQWDRIIAPFLAGSRIDYSQTLELSVGHGRMTGVLLERADRVIGVDVLQENIDFCRQRFAGDKRVSFIKNDGYSLSDVPTGSISFVFCWDSMVHFDSDIVRSYLAEFHRILKPGGRAFLHHSNLSKGPAADFNFAAHARNFMTREMFEHFAHKENLRVEKAKIIDWGAGEKLVKGLDCLTLLVKGSA